jgi:hypothetical protein
MSTDTLPIPDILFEQLFDPTLNKGETNVDRHPALGR